VNGGGGGVKCEVDVTVGTSANASRQPLWHNCRHGTTACMCQGSMHA
jgi:hypothetical protein